MNEQTTTATGAWIVGHNMAGYLPESDVAAFAEYADADDYYVSMVREYAAEDDERNNEHAEPDWADDDWGRMRATVDSILRDGDDVNPDPTSAGRGMIVGDSDDRRISFWLMWSPDATPDTDDE